MILDVGRNNEQPEIVAKFPVNCRNPLLDVHTQYTCLKPTSIILSSLMYWLRNTQMCDSVKNVCTNGFGSKTVLGDGWYRRS